MSKRKLGLGKSKVKKQKVEETVEKNENESGKDEQLLTVELTDEVNPDDPLSQLFGLWKTWKESDRSNELILNGIINECDRILRNCIENGGNEKISINDNFYNIYGQALSDISKFKPENEVSDWISNAIERIDEGMDKFGNNNIRLLFAKCNIIINKIAVEFIGQMNVDSKKDEFPHLKKQFKEFTSTWNKAIKECEKNNDYSILKEDWVLEILDIFDDLLDIIDKFGTQMNEVVDSDDEDDEDDDESNEKAPVKELIDATDFEISEDHPLYEIQNDDSYNFFWRDNMIKYKELIGDDADIKLIRNVNEKLGQSYLMEAEGPIAFFTSYQYERDEDDDNEEDDGEEMKASVEEARKEAIKLVEEALKHLRKTHNEEEPKTWVNIAEALITYANLLELDSEEQENTYLEAEKLLRRANNATHGHYEDILNSLIK